MDDAAIQERWETDTTRIQRHVIRMRPTSQQRPILPPPPVWADARRAEGMDDAAIRERWERDTPPLQRHSIRTRPRAAIRGWHRHDSEEAAAASARASHAATTQRQSASRLAFHEANTKGCAVAGCALAPSDGPHQLPPGLFVYTRRVGAAAATAAPTWTLGDAERTAELPNLDCLCLWHFFARGRESEQQQQQQPAGAEEGGEEEEAPSSSSSSRSKASRLAAMKAAIAACQHPVHASMPYAVLVPPPTACVGFFAAVLCRQPVGLPRRIGDDADACLRELEAGTARLDCKFCRQLTTVCERAKLYGTAINSQAQFQQLLRLAPAFVQHFEEATAAVDWAAECARLNANKTGPRGDRKRKEPPAAAAAAAAAAVI